MVAMFDAMREEIGTVDVVINNAGLQPDAPVDKMTLAQWQKRLYDMNLAGQFLLLARSGARGSSAEDVRPEEFRAQQENHICVSSVHEVIFRRAGH